MAISPLEFVKAYVDGKDILTELSVDFSKRHSDKTFTKDGLSWQILYKINIISSIESYLMAYWNESQLTIEEEEVINLAKETLAYFLSDEKKQKEIIELFSLLAKHVNSNFIDSKKRKAYGKTLFGVKDLIEIENWTTENLDKLLSSKNIESLLTKLWPILKAKISNKIFQKIAPQDALLKLALNWIKGMSYQELLNQFQTLNPIVVAGTQKRKVKQETIIELCDNAFAFDATLIIAAVREVIEFLDNGNNEALIGELNILQKRIKYGLPNSLAIAFYETGFSDRVITQELWSTFVKFSDLKKELIFDIKENESSILKVLIKYPEYYKNILREIVLK